MVGAGVIGVGVVQDLAQTGHDVVVVDNNADALVRAGEGLRRSVRLHHMIAGTGEPLDVAQVLGRIRFTTEAGDLSDRQFIVENVTEDWEIKRQLYEQIDQICEPSCTFAANTSIIPIAKIASATDRASNVLGMHFMNPVPLKPVVEVIRGEQTSDATIDRGIRLLSQMNKSAVVVNDAPGFVSNRVLMLMINEAASLVQEGVASAPDVDAIFRDCFGHAMGPLETADLIGIDTIVNSLDGLEAEFKDTKFHPSTLLGGMVDDGWLGRKSGQGFYSYQQAGSVSDARKEET